MKSPFPWFGGKSQAAEIVWRALGDVDHYVEPFAGSLAVLLRRPHPVNRAYHSETVNDADGLLVNAWRAIQMHPDATADAASWPVAEADLHARHLALVRWRAERQLEHLMGTPAWCDPQMAGWWLWGISCWIGGGWCRGNGPWVGGEDDRIVRREKDEPGVERRRPQLSSGGQGVNNAALREPGVNRQIPFLSTDGQGVNNAALREPGVEYHAMTMPRLREWFRALAARLRHVRILTGDWTRAVTNSATNILSVRGGGHCGIFLDPPYADTADRDASIYSHDSLDVAHDVRAWALEHGDDPKYRIVLAGFEGEHGTAMAGWREIEWFRAGFLTGGLGNVGGAGNHQQKRERLWLSPHCLAAPKQGDLWV